MSLYIELGKVRVLLQSDFPELTHATARALESDGVHVSDTSRAEPGELAVTIVVRRSASRPSDWDVRPGDLKEFRFVDNVTYRYSAGRNHYFITAGERAWGTIDFAASEVQWHTDEITDPRCAVNLMVLDPLSLILPQYECLICHAASVEIDHRAALLYGKSGVGKSTISFLLSQRAQGPPIRVITDDTVVLDLVNDRPLVHPVYTGFGLSPTIAAEHGLDADGCRILCRNRGKNYYARVPGQLTGGAPVNRIVFLCNCNHDRAATVVEPLTAGEAVLRLLASQSSIPHPALIRKVSLLHRLASETKSFEVSYASHCDLDLLASLISSP